MHATILRSNTVAFNAIFAATKEIPFNPEWNNGTGYFDGAEMGPNAPLLHGGEVVRATDPKGRRILIMGTCLGNVVVFQHFSDRDDVFVWSSSLQMRNYTGEKVSCDLSAEELTYVFGDDSQQNLGRRLAKEDPAVINPLVDSYANYLMKRSKYYI